MLEIEGFKTTWKNPFLEWRYPDNFTGKSIAERNKVLYVIDPSVPLFAPFDLSMVSIEVEEQFIFKLSMFYVYMAENYDDESVYGEIFNHFAEDWSSNIDKYFYWITEKLPLKQQGEYYSNNYIEDYLIGNFENDKSIIDIMIALRKYDKKRSKAIWEYCSNSFINDLPQINDRLKQYYDFSVFLVQNQLMSAYAQFRNPYKTGRFPFENYLEKFVESVKKEI